MQVNRMTSILNPHMSYSDFYITVPPAVLYCFYIPSTSAHTHTHTH